MPYPTDIRHKSRALDLDRRGRVNVSGIDILGVLNVLRRSLEQGPSQRKRKGYDHEMSITEGHMLALGDRQGMRIYEKETSRQGKWRYIP
jgi:hypothetical protein